ncbi:flagellar protein FlgN [Arthrobacter sp. MI7-26]|uniref:flagellar protein FlgN n=1 Tax=Arthrobacter sp. MI7-26 TaxID=2993653 RepID=UPI0022490EF3|nr:flagellar protein FlgN [Arthrobacter sp. MI7-26]MCX2749012.1 flagellar protein FlgN [Arthrobacter sp. MI7-26]
MGADELSAMLWRERRQLELLLFRLETQLLHVRAGSWHWLKFTAADVEKVLENLRFDTLARNIESSAVAIEWRVPANATLPMISSVAPPGIWPELLQEHHHAMVLLLEQVESAVAANVEALLSGPIGAGDVRLTAGQPGDVLAPEATSDAANAADDVMLLAENANIERALAVTRDCSLPLLEEFLGLA